MAIGTLFSQYRNSKNSRGIPVLNEITSNSLYSSDIVSYYNYKKVYMTYYKTIPECTALVNKVATDLNADYEFEPVDKGATGRNKIKQARIFAQNINISNVNFSHFVDVLVTGEAYGYKGSLNKEAVIARVKESLANKGLPQTKELVDMSYRINFTDEDALRPRKYRYVASTTMENVFDDYDVTAYRQRVGTKTKNFTPEEIIHYKFYDVDGRVSGFSCVGSIIVQLELLRFMWQNQTAVAKNGGHMDKIISVEGIDINSPAYKRMESELKRYNLDYRTRHGILLLNGKVEVTELQQLDSMQFKEMGLYITGLIAMQWSVPKSSIPYIVGGTNTQADTGGISEVGYWKNIRALQNAYLSLMNTQLWIPHFGVRMYFKETYNHQDLLEEQKNQTHLNNLTFMNNLLMKTGKKLSEEFLMKDLGLAEDDVEEYTPEMQAEEQSMFRQALQPNEAMKGGSDAQKKKAAKKNSAEAAKRNNANSGYGKELNFFEREVKKEFLDYKEVQQVSFQKFVKLYNEDKSFNKEPPRVFYSERDGVTHLIYKSTDFVYECYVPSTEMSGVFFMNFIKLYRVDEELIRFKSLEK